MKSLYLTLVLLTSAIGFGQADKTDDTFGSLTPKNYKPVFQTRTARKVGDILTIIISETSAAQYQTNTQNQKKEANTVGPNKVPLMDWLNVGLLSQLTSGGATSADAQLTTTGQSNQQGRLTARMTVVVKQILANGTLVVEGTRAVKFSRETQTLTLSGICRIDDIRFDNSILSENLANAEIKSEGVGAIYERQRRGLVTRLLDWLF
jgi:flagellar L-ring protein precursor FlgH